MNAVPSATRAGRAVYGLRVLGLDDVLELAEMPVPVGFDTTVRVQQVDGVAPALAAADHDRSVRALPDGRVLALDRRAGTATFFGPRIAPDQFAHPYLGSVATTFNRWAGRETFHAGAFVAEGRAWVVVGPREAGKSTFVAALAARGVAVLSDDIVVTDGVHAFAGPRCVDLRNEVPGLSLATTPSRGGTRRRLGLPGIEPRVPLGGWVFLGWGGLAAAPVGPHELLPRLARRRSWQDLPSDPVDLLRLATLPAWDLTRPKDWARLDDATDLLLSTVRAAGRACRTAA